MLDKFLGEGGSRYIYLSQDGESKRYLSTGWVGKLYVREQCCKMKVGN